MHALGQAVARDIDRIQLRLGTGQLFGKLLILLSDRFGLCPQFVQRGQPHGNLPDAELVAQHQVFLCLFGLLLQRADLELQFFNFVVDADEILFRLFQLALGFFFPIAVAGNPGSLFKDFPTVRALGGDDIGNLPLADDGVAVAAEARVHQEAVDVLQADRFLVDIIFALAAAIVAAGEHKLTAFRLKEVFRVIENQGNLCKSHWGAHFGSAEDDILHLIAAQGLGTLFPHDPENRVGDVGLARTVGTHDGRDVLLEGEAGLVRETLEPLYFQCL